MSDYLEKADNWNENNIAEKISNIRLIVRIMPSQKTEGNAQFMDWVSMTTDTEYKDSASSQSYYYNKSLHIYNDTNDYFPPLNFNSEYIPVGDSKTMCVNIGWAPQRKWRVVDMYKSLSQLPNCSLA